MNSKEIEAIKEIEDLEVLIDTKFIVVICRESSIASISSITQSISSSKVMQNT